MTILAVLAHIEWGPAPDWLAAIGTVGALAVALVLFAREQDDRRRAQARSIGAWTTPPVPRVQRDGSVRVAYEFVVVNRSSAPVHQLLAVMVDPDSPFAADPERAADAQRAGGEPTITFFVRLAPPGFEQQERHYTDEVFPGPVSMSFVDSNGRRWKRLPSGALHHIGGPIDRAAYQARVGCGALWHGPRR